MVAPSVPRFAVFIDFMDWHSAIIGNENMQTIACH